MKKTRPTLSLCALIFLLAIACPALSQTKSKSPASAGAKCFGEGTNVLNIGAGFWTTGRYYNYGKHGAYRYYSSPALNFSFEHGLKKLGPGYLGLGAYFAVQKSWYRFDDYYYAGNKYYYRHNWTYGYLAFRGVYHADELMTDNAELYFGASLGLRYARYKFESDSPDPDKHLYYSSGGTYPAFSVFAGGRYYFSSSLGLFAEVGYGMQWLTAGLSIKF